MKKSPKTLSDAAAEWRAGRDWARLKPRTQSFYDMALRPIERWAGKRALGRITRKAAEEFLDTYDDRPAMRAAVRTTLSQIFQHARVSNPIDGIRLRRPGKAKRAVELWTRADVETYAAAAAAMAWPDGALLIRLMWETTADQTDIVSWTPKMFRERDGVFRVSFRRGKTGEPRQIAVSDGVAALLRILPPDEPIVRDLYGHPYPATKAGDDARMWQLRRVRDAAVAAGARRLLYDHLRHTGASEAVDTGGSYEDARALTGHASKAVLERCYVQQATTRADAVQRARGIIG